MSSSSSSITVGNLSFDPKDAAEDQLGELGIERLRTLYVEIGGMQDPAKDFGAHHRTAHWKIIRACMVIWEHLNIVVYDALDKCHYFVHVPEEGGTEAGEDVPQYPPSEWHRSGANTKLAQGPLRQIRRPGSKNCANNCARSKQSWTRGLATRARARLRSAAGPRRLPGTSFQLV
jgi:hypothetical protein